MRAAETSDYETGNPTRCNRRMVRLRRFTRVPKFAGILRISGQGDNYIVIERNCDCETESGLLASQGAIIRSHLYKNVGQISKIFSPQKASPVRRQSVATFLSNSVVVIKLLPAW